ncbi:MAG: hypothetical protein RLZZ46_685 [Bacteroidota bacterium]|jgi:2-C-methyl-D-erythritol 4-phosphate cytidylyltransferase
MDKHALIVAGGSGLRMGSSLPKQFLLLRGQPVIVHSIYRFLDYDKEMKITVVLPGNQIVYWTALWEKYGLGHHIHIVEGGEQRFDSVFNGLQSIGNDDCLVAIHDGVRPLVSKETIADAFRSAEERGCGIPVIPVQDSLRKKGENGKISGVNRSDYVLVQTPQCFRSGLIKKAYQQKYESRFTDDATVFEAAGNEIFLTEGNRENIKLTTPSDMIMAEAFLSWANKD